MFNSYPFDRRTGDGGLGHYGFERSILLYVESQRRRWVMVNEGDGRAEAETGAVVAAMARLRGGDDTRVDHLKSFCGAEKRLKLFEANIYKAEEFEAAIQGCEFVFHVATPLLHTEGLKHTNRVDATLDAARSIATACIRSGTVRRLVYTATVMAASPLKDDGSGFKDFMDETCWTPLNLSIPYNNDFLQEYTQSKTLAEKELLSFGSTGNGKMEVVTLACGLVGGENLIPNLSGSVITFLAQLTNDEFTLNSLKFLEELLAKIPIVHIDDVCDAHIFCMKQSSMNGRFLCANAYISTAEIAGYYKKNYPEFSIRKEHLEDPKNGTKWGSNLLNERGFQYKCDWHMVLDDCISFARKHRYLGL
ncbi:hypothetical protein BUALT_Bualt19G0004700 [Buddleja alternifolia]|uniref:NAD-dependent epimerase/dehydratase domain-containing protein n=1 Tax=Buddleja alternifolia TaxID=168488 RepID=A0AAV6W8D8_9LAMI|nr:hypothetical protein BUALT_Bualt19G0004700 [Buddleja alternifolia]